MQHSYKLIESSGNKKTGRMPASITSMSSCPKRCTLKNNGCYADIGPLLIHWRAVDHKGTDLDTFCDDIRKLPKRVLWRHNQAGDLPGDGKYIDSVSVKKIVDANGDRHGYTYTHYSPVFKRNAAIIKHSNNNGFTINLSANTIKEADEFVALGVGPVVTVVPIKQLENMTTPAGNTVVICPAVTKGMTCTQCELCAVPTRTTIIGFPAHGVAKNKAEKVFWAKTVK